MMRRGFALLALACLASGCTTADIDIDYAAPSASTSVAEAADKLTIGNFSDRRGRAPDWWGEIGGRFYYPKDILRTEKPVSEVVRQLVEQAAEERGMLGGGGTSPVYQLYGQIVRLNGVASEPASAHAHLVVRLFDLENDVDVYDSNLSVDKNNLEIFGSSDELASSIQEALNEVIAQALDDEDFRKVLLLGSEDS